MSVCSHSGCSSQYGRRVVSLGAAVGLGGDGVVSERARREVCGHTSILFPSHTSPCAQASLPHPDLSRRLFGIQEGGGWRGQRVDMVVVI